MCDRLRVLFILDYLKILFSSPFSNVGLKIIYITRVRKAHSISGAQDKKRKQIHPALGKRLLYIPYSYVVQRHFCVQLDWAAPLGFWIQFYIWFAPYSNKPIQTHNVELAVIREYGVLSELFAD